MTVLATRGPLRLVDDGDGKGHVESGRYHGPVVPVEAILKWGYWKSVDDWGELTAATWNEDDHPRDPGGEGGGQFVPKFETHRVSGAEEGVNDEMLMSLMDEAREWPGDQNVPQAIPKDLAIAGIGTVGNGQGNLILIRDTSPDHKLIGVGSWDEYDGKIHGGEFGAIEGAGVPLFREFLRIIVEKDVPAVWSATPRAGRFYKALAIPQVMSEFDLEEFYLSPDDARALLEDFTALQDRQQVSASSWDESKHPRHPRGTLTAAAQEYDGDGAMVAIYPSPEQQERLAQKDGQDADGLHVTLAFLPEGLNGDLVELSEWLEMLASGTAMLTGEVTGIGEFAEGEDGVPIFAIPSVPGLAEIRTGVVYLLEMCGFTVSHDYDFVPHITLRYGGEVDDSIVGTELTFDHLCVATKEQKIRYPFAPTRLVD